ncbi:MAG: RNA polymerase sigma factor [Saprospiraceae bacterium]|nr:RNA polymerase sigma factor [Saprospiraceae bacterium]MCF8250344.1 RNA polymerase sigma factor [Saprospiraceae bacterium]MCF8280419.1 RNA polymerase sigma factor [Bacteroidales bacterium]MCF8312152.1 RNA polymerase sigma factor [Saprospiraceae bacterium]MCF8441884.1 RNA polymerase sigma factor [Saprospiraceae bacterium]
MQNNLYTTQSPDALLVEGCRQQHRMAQGCLYQRYFGRLLGICMRYTGSRPEAEDVLNRAFLKIFQSIGEYSEQGSLFGWMATITLRTAIDFVRSQVKMRSVFRLGEPPEMPHDNGILDQLAAEEIYRLIQKLPPDQRAVFSMNVVEGYTHREIAELLGINENTSKWRLSEAKKQLRERLLPLSPKGEPNRGCVQLNLKNEPQPQPENPWVPL